MEKKKHNTTHPINMMVIWKAMDLGVCDMYLYSYKMCTTIRWCGTETNTGIPIAAYSSAQTNTNGPSSGNQVLFGVWSHIKIQGKLKWTNERTRFSSNLVERNMRIIRDNHFFWMAECFDAFEICSLLMCFCGKMILMFTIHSKFRFIHGFFLAKDECLLRTERAFGCWQTILNIW